MLTYGLGMAAAASPSSSSASSAASAEADALFAALASADRRRMLDLIVERPGMHVAALATHFAMSDVAVLKHVGVLERAGLLLSRREGRQRLLFVNVMPIRAICERWMDAYAAFWSDQMLDIKSRVEARTEARTHPHSQSHLGGRGQRRA